MPKVPLPMFKVPLLMLKTTFTMYKVYYAFVKKIIKKVGQREDLEEKVKQHYTRTMSSLCQASTISILGIMRRHHVYFAHT